MENIDIFVTYFLVSSWSWLSLTLIESDDRPVNRECPICIHSIHYMSIGMRILVAPIKTISCTIFDETACISLNVLQIISNLRCMQYIPPEFS